MSTRRRIALTIGDPNGIGPEIAVRAAQALETTCEANVVLVGDPFVIESYQQRLAPDTAFSVHAVDALPRGAFAPGTISADAGRATAAYVQAAVELVRAGSADAIVACPHSETAVHAAGIAFSGYPSLLARLLGVPEDRVFLLLIGGGLRIVHATLHERLADAIARLTPELIVEATRAAADALRIFGISAPRIGVFGINPHGSEGGLFGPEDAQITEPAVTRLRELGLDVEGPTGADVLLAARACDAYVAMYHDQGHIPVKLLAGRTSAAVSVGAGVLFSSVGHGTGFDIAGRDLADPSAVIAALQLVGAAAQPVIA